MSVLSRSEFLDQSICSSPEIVSLVIYLKAMNGCNHVTDTGRLLHGLWHSIWREVSEIDSEKIHPDNSIPTFTLSPILGIPALRSNYSEVMPGQTGWFRVSTLQSSVSKQLLESSTGWLSKLPSTIELGHIRWNVFLKSTDKLSTEFSRITSYQDIASRSSVSTQWEIKFHTPTSFSGKFSNFSIPLPELLISSWLNRWNLFCPDNLSLPDSLIENAKNNLRITHYKLNTIMGNRNSEGCVGTTTIRAFDLPSHTRKQLDILFRYAFFCGTGHHTAQGMGMTQLINWKTNE